MRRGQRHGRAPDPEPTRLVERPSVASHESERAADLPASHEESAAAVDAVQERLGNSWLVSAIDAGGSEPFAAMIVGEMGLAATGIAPTGGFVESGNQAVLATMRHGVDDVQAGPEVARALASTGARLPSAVLSRMESALGHEFGGVRLHLGAEADKAAKEIQARAFAVGRDLFFASGEFTPGSEKGDEIIAHELTHVIQYDEGRLDGKSGVSSPYDSEEREADANAAAAVDFLASADLAAANPLGVGSLGAAPLGAAPFGSDSHGAAGSLGGDVEGPAAGGQDEAVAASDAGLVARKDAPGAPQPKADPQGKADPPVKVDPAQGPNVHAPSPVTGPKGSADAKGPDAKAPGASKAAPGGAAGAADTQARSFKDLVSAAVTKAPKVVQGAATNLKQAEKKLPDDPSAVRSKLPDLLKSRFKPVVEPLVPHKPGEALSLDALVGVVGTMVTALPELVKHAGADAEADAKEKKDKQDAQKADGKAAGKDPAAPNAKAPAKGAAAPSVTPHEPGKDAAKDPKQADPKQADAGDDTTQFFVTAIAEALAALCPVPPPAPKEDDAKDPALLNGPKVAVDPLNPSHPKAKDPDKAVDPKAAADEKAYKKQQLKWEIEGLKNDEERITRTRDGLSQQVAATEAKIKAATTEMDTRRAYLEHQAAVAKKRGKKTKPLNKDSRLRQLQHEADELPKEVARLKAEMERVEKELAAAVEKREKDEEALRAMEAEAAAHAGGGGGVHIPPPTDFVATSKAVLAALQPKEKKLKTEADKAKADWQKLKDEVTTLEGNVKKGNEDLAALQKKKDGHVAEVTRLEGLVKSRTAFLNTPGKDGAPAPGTAGDTALEGYKSGIAKANAARIEINKQITELGRQLKTWNDQLHTKKIALEAAEEKKTTTENATTNFATAVKSLQDVQGCPNWQMIVNDYKLGVKAIPLAPGMVRDENGQLVKEADLKKKNEEPPKTKDQLQKEAADKAKAKADQDAEDAKLTKDQRDKRDAEAKKKKEQDFLQSMSAAKDLPKAEREIRLAELAKEHNKSIPDMQAEYAKKVALMAKSITPGMTKEQAEKAGLATQFDLVKAQNDRLAREEKAKALFGTQGQNAGEDAVDLLWKHARERGLSKPDDMLKHLANVDPNTLPESLKGPAQKMRAEENARIAKLSGVDKDKALDEQSKAQAAAKDSEKRFTKNKELGLKLHCSPEEAALYVKSLATSAGTGNSAADEDLAREALMVEDPNKKPSANRDADLKDINKKLKDIHMMPIGPGRQAALMALAKQTGDPKLLVGGALVPEAGDGVLIAKDGNVASPVLKSQLDSIDKLPPDKQWDAVCSLAAITGQSPNDLARARSNLVKKNDVVHKVTDIEQDETLSPTKKKELIQEIATANKVDIDKLRDAARLERNKTADSVVEACKKDPDLQKQLDALSLDAKKTPEERKQALKELARRTGLELTALEDWNNMYQFRQKRERWKQQFKAGSDDEAAAKMASLIEQYGSADAAKDHLRNCPRDKLPKELQALKDDLDSWDKENPGKEVAPKLKRVDVNDKDYKKRRDALLSELDSTVYVSDEKALKLLSPPNLSKEELAALMQEKPWVFKKFYKGVDGDAAEGKKAAELFGAAKAYQLQLDKEAADDAEKAKKASAVEAQVQTARDAATALNMPFKEAKANLQAVADGNGMTTAQALVWLKSQPGKSPEQALKAAYAEEPGKDSPQKVNAVLRARLEAIDLLPARDRSEALKTLKDTSGIGDSKMDKALTETRRDTSITADMHALRDLPKSERDAALQTLVKKYKLKDTAALESIYREGLERTAIRFGACGLSDDDILPKTLSLSPEDIAKHVKELARKTGQSEESIKRLVEARRSQGFGADAARMLGGEDKVDAFKKAAADVNMTPSQYADWLARSPAGMLKGDQLALKKQLEAQGNKPVRTDAEKKEIEKALGADASDVEYRKKAAALTAQLQSGHEDADILAKYGSMTPGQQKLFKEEYERETGKKLAERFENSLNGADEDRGLRMLAKADAWDSQKDAEEAMKAVDPTDKDFNARMENLQKELAKGSDASADKVGQMLLEMPLNQRAEFLRQYDQARQLAPQGVDMADGKRQKYLPIDLKQLLNDNKEALGALNQGMALKGATTPVKDADNAQRIQESIRIGGEASAALGVDQRTAFRLVDGLAKDSGMSPSNALLFLQGKEIKPEADKRSKFVKDMCDAVSNRALLANPTKLMQSMLPKAASDDKVNGQTLNQYKVDNAQAFFTDGKSKSDAAIVAMLSGCNPRELAELDKKLQAGDPPRSLKDLTKGVTGKDKKELGPLLQGMQDYADTESHYKLIKQVKDEDPRKDADVTTPDGFASKLQWCKDLPPEDRIRELNKLRADAGGKGATHFGAKEVMAAWLNGPQGVGTDPHEPHMLSSAMSAELDAIDRLPSQAAKDDALRKLAVLTGRWNGGGLKETERDFARARTHTAQGMQVGKKMQDIQEMPEDQRQQAILDLSKSAGLSIDALHGLHQESLKAGLVVASVKTVTPAQANRLAEIRKMPADQQAGAIKDFEQKNNLSPRDINAHLQTDLEATQKKIAERNRAQQGADALKDKMVAGDTDGVKKQLEAASNDPAELKRILDAYGPELQKDLRVLYGDRRVAQASMMAYVVAGDDLGQYTADHDINYRLVCDMVKAGKEFEQAPELPSGVPQAVSDEVRRIRMNMPQDQWQGELDTLRAQKGISEEDFAIVMKNAEVNQRQFEKTVQRKMALLEAEKTSDSWVGRHLEWVSDSNVDAIAKGISPEVMAEINKRNPALVQNIQQGLDGNVQEDFNYNLKLGTKLQDLPMDEHAKVLTDERVNHKAEQLQQEFEGFYKDTARIKALLKDCSAEEFKALNARFDGKLQDKIDNANEGGWGNWLVGAGVVGLALFMGPLAAAVVGVTATGAALDDKDPEWMAIKMRLKDATTDPKAPFDPATNKAARDAARKTLESEFNSWWTRDSTVLSTLKNLSPRDLAELQKEYNAEHGEGALEAQLRKGVSGDHLVKSIAMLRDADDALAGIDRGQQMRDTIRQMAVKEVMEDLKKDPKNKGKTDSELYELAEKDEGKITEKAKEKQKKVSESSMAIFKAVDGWGDDEAAVQKTLAGLSLEEIELVKIEYRRHFGRDLDTHLSEDIGGKDLEVMQKLMKKETRVEGLQKYILTMSGIDTEHEGYITSYGGFGEDEEGIYAAFQAMSPEERTKVCSGPGGEKFLARVKLNLGSNEAAVVDALTEINPETGQADANPAHVAAAKIQLYTKGSGDWDFWSGWGTKEEELVKELDKLTPEQVQECAKWYENKYGDTLASVLADEMDTSSREFQICDAEMRGDKVEADVHRLKWAAQDENSSSNWLLAATGPVGLLASAGLSAGGVTLPVLFSGTDEELLEATLKAGKEKRGGRDAEHLAKVKERFNKMFGGGELGQQDGTGRTPIDRLIDQETSGVEKAYFTQLVAKGEADPEVELLYSMDGLGTDEERAKKVMERVYDMSSDERAAFKHRFAVVGQSMYGSAQSLDEWIDGDFSGTEGFEMRLKLRGKPEKPEDYLEIARMRWEFERGEGNSFMNSFMDGLESLGATSAGEVFANDTARIYAMFDAEGHLRPGVSQESLEEVAGWQTATALNYRETRDSITDAVVNTVQVIGAVVIAVVPGLQGVSAMIIANIVLAAATMALKAAMKGNGYGWEEGIMDLAQAAVTVATAGMGAKLSAAGSIAIKEGQVIAGKIGAYALKLADKFGALAEKLGGRVAVAKVISSMITESIQNGVQGFLNAALTSEQAMKEGDGAFFKHLLGGAVGGALQGAATAGIKGGISKTRLGKAIDEAKEVGAKASLVTKMGAHFANGVISSTINTVTDYNQWEAWAAGKGLDAATLRGAFLQGIAESVTGAAFENSIKQHQVKMAHQEIHTATTRMSEIHAALQVDMPAPERQALLKEHSSLQAHVAEHQQTIARLGVEEQEAAKQQEKARDEVEQKITRKSTDEHLDPKVDEAQTAAVKLVLDQTETKPLKLDTVTEPTPVVKEKPQLLLGPGTEKPQLLLGPGTEKPQLLLGPGTEKPPLLLGPGTTDKAVTPGAHETTHGPVATTQKATSATANETPALVHGAEEHHAAKPTADATVAKPTPDATVAKPTPDATVVKPTPDATLTKPMPDAAAHGAAHDVPAPTHDHGPSDPVHVPTAADGPLPAGPVDDLIRFGKRLIGKEDPADRELRELKKRMRDPAFVMPDATPIEVDAAPKGRSVEQQMVAEVKAFGMMERVAARMPTDEFLGTLASRNMVEQYGDFKSAHADVAVAGSTNAKDILAAYQSREVTKIAAELRESFPGLGVHVTPSATEPHALVISFEGGRTAGARGYLEHLVAERYGGDLDKAIGLRVSEAPVPVVHGAGMLPADARVSGKLIDPIASAASGAVVTGASGHELAYSSTYGFHGAVAADGAYEITRKVVLRADPAATVPADMVSARADTVRAVNETFNDPKYRIVVAGVERQMRVVVDVVVLAPGAAAPHGAHEITVRSGEGRANSSNLYTGGQSSMESAAQVRATTGHELAHAILGLGDTYKDDTRTVKKLFGPGPVPGEYAAHENTVVGSKARVDGGLHDIAGASLMDGAAPHVERHAQAVGAGETWESLATKNYPGISHAMAEAGFVGRPTLQDAVRALQGMNPHIGGDPSGTGAGAAVRALAVGDEVGVPKQVPHPSGGLHEHQLKQIEWAIEQARRGESATFKMGDGRAPDRLAAEAKQVAGGRQRYLFENTELPALAQAVADHKAGKSLSAADSHALLSELKRNAAGGELGEHLLPPSHQALALHHSELHADPGAQRALFEASGHAVGRMKAIGEGIASDLPGVEVSSLRKRNDFDAFVDEVMKKQRAKNYANVGEMTDIVRGRFNVETGEQMAAVASRLQEHFGADVVEVKPPREGYPRWHINVRDAETGLVHEWQVGTKATTHFFENKSLAIPPTITAFKGQPDFHDGVYKLLGKVTDPAVRARYGLDEMMPGYKRLTEETGRVTAEHPYPPGYHERYAALAQEINGKLAAIERDNPGYMNGLLGGGPAAAHTPVAAVAGVGPAPVGAHPAVTPEAALRTAVDAQKHREAALGPAWSAGVEDCKRGLATAAPDSPAHDGFRNRLMELERISRLPDAAEAHAQFRAIQANDSVATETHTRANSADLAEARGLLKANPNAELQPHHVNALLHDAIDTTRVQNLAQSGVDASVAHEPINQIGLAAPSQRRVAEALGAMGVSGSDITFHRTGESVLTPGAVEHYFTVAKMPDGRTYLVDPSFGQHLATGHDVVGRRLASDPHGATVARGLQREGFVLLDDATARTYGKALTGQDADFSAADFSRPNGVRAAEVAHSPTLGTHRQDFDAAVPEAASKDRHAATKEALAMHHSEWMADPAAQKAVFDASAEAVTRMRAMGAEVVHGMAGAEVASLRKRDDFGEFVAEVHKKQQAEGYEHVGKMCDIVRGRFNLETGADVDLAVARLKERYPDAKVKPPRDGYPRWHINVRDTTTGLVHEWQIGTKATTTFFETRSLTVPDTVTGFKGKPDFHDGVYKLLNKVKDPEMRARHGIDAMLPEYKQLAEATGRVTKESPLPERYAERYHEMTKAINEKLAAIEAEHPGYMNKVLAGEPTPAVTPKAAADPKAVSAPAKVSSASTPDAAVHALLPAAAAAHPAVAPTPAVAAPAPAPAGPIGVRGFLAERDKLGRMAYGSAYQYDVHDTPGVTEARIKVHMKGGASTDPAHVAAWKAHFAGMTDAQVAQMAIAEGNHAGWAPGTPSGAAGIEMARRRMLAGVEQYFNAPGFSVTGPDGKPSRLRVAIEFVDEPHLAQHVVHVENGGELGQAYSDKVQSFTTPMIHAHEAGHAIFGLLDEYADHKPAGGSQSNKPEGRRHKNDSRIAKDQSLYAGDVRGSDASGREVADPRTGLRDRHIEQIREQIETARTIAGRGWTPAQLDALMKGPAQFDEWQTPRMAPTEFHDAGTVNARRLRIAEKMTPGDYQQAIANGWNNAQLQSGQVRQVAAKMSAAEYAAARGAGWTNRQLAKADAVTLFDAGAGKSRAEIKAARAPSATPSPAHGKGTTGAAPAAPGRSAPAPAAPAPGGLTSHHALGMHHSEFEGHVEAQKALFDASAGAVSRMKAAGTEIVDGMKGAEVSSLRKRDTFDSFVSEVVKKQRSENYEHVGKMCDIVRGRFNVETGADVQTVVARLKEKFGDDVVKVKEPRDGYPRWHINVRDAETGLVHEWQVGTKGTTAFFETKSLAIPETITAFKGQPDFHDGVYKLLNKVSDPEVRARHGIDEMLPEYKRLAEETGKVTAERPVPERYAERYAEMTKAINAKLVAIEAENPGYMNAVLKGEPTPGQGPTPPGTRSAAAPAPEAVAIAAKAKFTGPITEAPGGTAVTSEEHLHAFGMPRDHLEVFQLAAKSLGLVFDVRPTNPVTPGTLAAAGFEPKDPAFKQKTAKSEDVHLGLPSHAVGSVVHYTPVEPTAEAYAAMSDKEAASVRKLYAQRVKERATYESKMQELVKKGAITIDNDGVVRSAHNGLPFAGDHDLYRVYSARTGKPISAEEDAMLARFMQGLGIDVKHGAHMAWQPETEADHHVHQAIVERHQGGEALLRIGATETSVAYHDTPVAADTRSRKDGGAPEFRIGHTDPAETARASTRTMAGSVGGEVAAMHEFEGRVLVQYTNGAMQWMEKAQAAQLRVAASSPGVPRAGANDKTIPPIAGPSNNAGAKTLPMTPVAGQGVGVPEAQPVQHPQRAAAKTLPMVPAVAGQGVGVPDAPQVQHPQRAQQQAAQHVAQQRAAVQQHPGPQRAANAAQQGQQPAQHVQQQAQQHVHQQPVAPGSQWAAQGQRVYANGGNTEFVHVDLAGDPALRRQLDRAHQATAAGATLEQKLALLSAHVKDGITYDMAAQQHEYQAHGGQVSLGTMIEQGSVVCREKALFTHAALAEMGIRSRVVVGTVPDGNGRTGGHAWVELADGTIIDGTWGRIFPAGNDPVQGRTKRSAQTFAEPRYEVDAGQASSASRGAASILSNPQEMDRMRRPTAASPEDLLVRPGVRAWHPDGRTPVTVEYSERDKVQVRHDDGRVEILSRAAFVGGNGWALQQAGQQAASQQSGRRTHAMAAYEPHPDVDAAGPDEKALKLMDARTRNQDLDKQVHEEVHAKTKPAGGGHSYVDETYDNVTVGAGFAGITNEVGQRAAGKGGRRLVIGEENPWLKANADLGQPAGGSEVDGGQNRMKDTAKSADARFMHAREHAENAEINRADAGVGLFKKRILGVELRPETVDASWHRPDARARIAVLEGTSQGGEPIIRYVYAKRVDIASGPGSARRLSDRAHFRGGGPVPDTMDPAEFSRLSARGEIIPRQIDPDLYRQLLAEKRILQSDQAFDPNNVEHGEHVLVYGAGASAAWGVEGSLAKAGKIDWLGRMAKPSDDLTPNQNTRLKKHYVDLEAALAAGDTQAAERHMRHIEHFTFTEAPNHGFLPRNVRDGGAFDPEQQSENDGKITRGVLPDLASVTREANPANGKQMIRVEGVDGSVRWCDRLVLAIGQDGNSAGGPGKILDKISTLRPLVDPSASDWGFPVVVGLQTPDSSVRVLGVAATSPVLRHKIETGSREFVEQSFALQAGDKSTVPLDSQGVIGSFHHAERMIRAANKDQLVDLASHTPEEQADILGVHHRNWRKKRDEDNARTKDAPELPQVRAK